MNLDKITYFLKINFKYFWKNFFRPWRIFEKPTEESPFGLGLISRFPNYKKTIIRFESSGCMAQIHTFKYIGTIIDEVYLNGSLFYKVEILKDEIGEIGESLEKEYDQIPSWYVRDLGNGVLILID